MSRALAVFHGQFGRASLYKLNRPLAPHAHREGHLIFLVEGAPATIVVDGEAHAITPDQGVAISPWQPHEFHPGDFSEGAVFLTLYISPRWFSDRAEGVHEHMRFGSVPFRRERHIDKTVERVVNAQMEGVRGDLFEGELLALTGASFEASWQAENAGQIPVWSRASDFRIRNAIRLMNERVTDNCVLDKIARDAGLSRPHFYKLFRQHVGLTPNLYLNTLRLEKSIDRLISSADAVTSIGLDLGFASQASFTRFFSNNVGIAPTDYRRVSLMN